MTTAATLGENALRQLGVAVVPVADRPALAAIVPAVTIATNALISLGVVAADEAPSASDAALALARVSVAHDALVANGSVSWALSAIPNAVADDYAILTALHLASSFGKQADPARQPIIEARVKRVAAIMRAPADAESAVLDVHNELAATGRVRWSVHDIPRPAERAYVDLASNLLAPLFGAKSDPQAEVSARRLLAQIIALPTSGERTTAEYY